MKIKNLLLIVLSVAFFEATAQQVDREEVLLEIGTGTWCGYCPGAAMGADELVENGHNVAVIEYHSGDEYENTASGARINYYGITGFPTAKFDGVETVEGGSGSSSMYSTYLPHVNSRNEVPSSFTIDVNGDHENMTDFTLEVNMEKVADTDADNIKLHAAVTESHIEDSWQGMDEVNFVERLMVPDHNGTDMDFSSNTSQTVELEFSLEDEWVVDNCELVVFLQDDNSKEVLQAIKHPISLIPGLNSYELSLEDMGNIPENDCMGSIAPTVDVQNNGSETITSFTVEYSVNGDTYTHEWEGTLETTDMVTVELPEVDYPMESTNTIEATVMQPNGYEDEYSNNNSESEEFEQAPVTNTTVDLLLRTDNNPSETTWEIVNSAGEVVHAGGPYETPNSWVVQHNEFLVDANDCYVFKLYDSGGDGISDGNGMCVVESTNGVMICSLNGTNFGSEFGSQFHASSATDILSTETPSAFRIYPNPTHGNAHVELGLSSTADVKMTVYNTLGKQVYRQDYGQLPAGSQSFELETDNMESGVYLIRLEAGNKEYKQRLIVK